MSTEGHRNETAEETYIRVTEPLLAFSIRGQQFHTRRVYVWKPCRVSCATDNFVSHVNQQQWPRTSERSKEGVEGVYGKMVGKVCVCVWNHECVVSQGEGGGVVNMPLVEQRMTELRGLLCWSGRNRSLAGWPAYRSSARPLNSSWASQWGWGNQGWSRRSDYSAPLARNLPWLAMERKKNY